MLKKISLVVTSAILFGCSTSIKDPQPASVLEAIVNRFMTDTATTILHTPSSYKFISLQADTLNGEKSDKDALKIYLESIQALEKQKADASRDPNTDSLTKSNLIAQIDESIISARNEIEDVKKHPSKPDSILQINLVVRYQEIDKQGKTIFSNAELIYYPKEMRIVEKIGE